ncbi:MAG: ATP-binding cassette domain-containing protein [Austwickia sp.]|nr:ATP-binding cassette domain-containing protein [Austwickia sp.]
MSGESGRARPAEGPAEPIVATQHLTREFVRRERMGTRRTVLRAVDDLTLTIAPGEAVGYIGANGAGKSTTIKMLTGILTPSAGQVRTGGLDPLRHRKELARRIGVVFGQRSQLWWDLPTAESFRILGAIHRLGAQRTATRTQELVERLELGEYLDRPVRQLSLGQRMRAEIAAALLHSPELLILDEPTIGLDLLSKQRLREFLVAERAAYGRTLLLTTHDMGDIERLCDRVLVVDRGRLVYDGSLPGLAAQVGAQRVLVVDLAAPTPDLIGIPATTHLGSQADGLRQRLAFDPAATSAAVVLAAVATRAEVRDLSIEEPDIEDVVRRLYLAAR